ncbi:hypothetical protein [Dokdonella sp.]|uniref:hypothetical protein n=1 Tax=Dokdonella sp. TaxID=2291710 RepID=UPI0027B9A150|nr:hypothetical protein [Dokdonella sp.]
MSGSRLKETIVVGATCLAAAPLVFVFLGSNLRWLDSDGGAIVLFIVTVGLLVGILGGISLAIARKNPLWLLATVSTLCAGYVWILVAAGMAIGHMH